MNGFASSKTEVFEKVEESLRQCKGVEDLNDEEIMELYIISKDLNTCETTSILKPSRFVSHAARLGLREGFAVDLTVAIANGTMWDLSFEDDRTELRPLQIRQRPELRVGSPPRDDFSSLLSTCVKPEHISAMKTERLEPQIRTCVQAYKLQMEMQKRFIHEHPNNSTSCEMPKVQSLASDPRVCSIDGPMWRWCMKARRPSKQEFIRTQTRWLTRSREYVADAST